MNRNTGMNVGQIIGTMNGLQVVVLAGFSIRTNMGLRPRHGRWATRPSINDFRRERRRPWCQRALVAWW